MLANFDYTSKLNNYKYIISYLVIFVNKIDYYLSLVVYFTYHWLWGFFSSQIHGKIAEQQTIHYKFVIPNITETV